MALYYEINFGGTCIRLLHNHRALFGVLGIVPPLLAVTLIGSAVLTYMLGPFGGTPYDLAFWLLLMSFILSMLLPLLYACFVITLMFMLPS